MDALILLKAKTIGFPLAFYHATLIKRLRAGLGTRLYKMKNPIEILAVVYKSASLTFGNVNMLDSLIIIIIKFNS